MNSGLTQESLRQQFAYDFHSRTVSVLRDILSGPMGDRFRSGENPVTLYGQPIEGATFEERLIHMDRICRSFEMRMRQEEQEEEMSEPQHVERETFSYGFGRASAAEASFSLVTRKVDLGRSVDMGRWQWEGNVGKCFPKPDRVSQGVTQVMGSFQIGWAVATEQSIIHIRAQSVRTGYAANVGEAAIILTQSGPGFNLSMNIPTTADFPSNEILVFQGRGWMMDPDMLAEFNLDVLHGNEEVYFWSGKDYDEYDDSGLFNYEERSPSRADRPTAFVNETVRGETVAALVPSQRRRRRIRTRR